MADDAEVAAYEWLIEGFRRSVARLGEVVEAYIPLFEALNWAASIADRLGVGNKPDLLGPLSMRNAVHHEWIRALKLTPRGYGEGRYGEGRYGGLVWRWKSDNELQVQKTDADRQPLYQNLLAGRSALDTLRKLDSELPADHH